MVKYKWTDNQIAEAVKDAYSVSDVRRILGAGEGGNAWRHLKKRISDLDLDTSHFDPYRGRKGQRKGPAKNLLVKTDHIPAPMSSVKKQYLSQRTSVCCDTPECGIVDSWLGKPIRLHMDHVDGDRSNNAPENLRLLCPNCHDQTETWGRTVVTT